MSTKLLTKNINDYMWIARDKDNSIRLYNFKPFKNRIYECWCSSQNNNRYIFEYFDIPENHFPEVKWEDVEPTEVEIVIKNK